MSKSKARPAQDTRRCPLCEGDNACAMATGHPDSPCWCTRVRIDAAVLDRLPPEQRGLRCICRGCAVDVPADHRARSTS